MCLFLAIGCKDNKNVGAENVDGMEQANAIIGYTNTVIDYMNDSNSYLNSRQSDLVKLVNATEKKKTLQRYEIPKEVFFVDHRIGLNKKNESLTVPPTVLSEEEQAFFKQKVGEYKKNRDLIAGTGVVYIKYLNNEDCKDNKWIKAEEYAKTLEKAYEACQNIRPLILDKVDVVTEKAEAIILADSPIKDAIMTVKGDLKSIEQLVDLFYTQAEEGGKKQELEDLYKKIETNFEQHKGLYVEELTKEHKLDSYTSFYSSVSNELGEVRKVLRKVREGKKVTEDDLDKLLRVNNKAVGSYNIFI